MELICQADKCDHSNSQDLLKEFMYSKSGANVCPRTGYSPSKLSSFQMHHYPLKKLKSDIFVNNDLGARNTGSADCEWAVILDFVNIETAVYFFAKICQRLLKPHTLTVIHSLQKINISFSIPSTALYQWHKTIYSLPPFERRLPVILLVTQSRRPSKFILYCISRELGYIYEAADILLQLGYRALIWQVIAISRFVAVLIYLLMPIQMLNFFMKVQEHSHLLWHFAYVVTSPLISMFAWRVDATSPHKWRTLILSNNNTKEAKFSGNFDSSSADLVCCQWKALCIRNWWLTTASRMGFLFVFSFDNINNLLNNPS
ncbi:hypothetical protein EGR_05498 [Echinococcus granulosus]|uniref:Uncharacterized protein n=1 Tax=Echinococcus granulosus TaxID=6210 RepID=W6V182_ECHGR|nr:hypothetical protein EGR_05498 [Echinococcus granulosus]EUB59599.1 hypothetical protein EGR_05498 [Echinococcus granulosus]